MSETGGAGGRFGYYAERPSPEYDNVILQADYAKRAYLSFYRFRRLGGARRPSKQIQPGEAMHHGVHYVSDHPPVRMFNLSVIALLVLFESAANAYFFSLQSEMGLAGGVFQAGAVSLSNVAVAYFIIGFWGLRHASAPVRYHWPKKLWGIIALIFGTLLAVIISLSAAHYRNLLELEAAELSPPTADATPLFPWLQGSCEAYLQSDVAASFAGAAASAVCRPMSLHSLDSIVLFALGLAIAALAAFEGRRSDAAFPGFSDAARMIERAREDLQDALEEYYESYEAIVQQIKDDLKADGENGREFTPADREALFRALDERVEGVRRLLSTSNRELSDEFGVSEEVVREVCGDCARPDGVDDVETGQRS